MSHEPPRQPLPDIKPLKRSTGGVIITIAIILTIVVSFLAAYLVSEYGKDQSVVNEIQTQTP
ncbi:MAG: hypothetical protein RhofKO_20110 [Rhodothermales bacterium]